MAQPIRKIMSKKQMEEWLKEFLPNEDLEQMFKNSKKKENTWTFTNVQGILIGRLIVRNNDVFGSTAQYVDEEYYIVLTQVRLFL